MKVLVTGGAGFIGSNLCELLLQQQYKVICFDNFATGYYYNIEAFLNNPNFKLIQGDIRNYEDCASAVQGVDYVFHQAALGSVPRSIKDPITSVDVNVSGFVKMLYASVEAKVKRFIYAASSSTYGDSTVLPKKEHIIGNPLSPYAVTKYVDELFAKNFADMYGIETIGLRYFNVFGRKQDINGAYAAVIPTFVIQLMQHSSPVINGDGSYSRDFTYIDNVLHANQIAAFTTTENIKKAAEDYYAKLNVKYDNSKTLSEVFNVAFGERTNLIQLANYLKDNLSLFDPKISEVIVKHGDNRFGDIPHSLASIEKGKNLFNYSPQYSVKDGLKLATKWYWENYSIKK
jgi:UDP-N-acetylglucosamine 4-epimerase